MSKIESVVIIGGGSSGWMTAAALSKLCPHLEIALIESDNVKTVGVGESTLGHINRYLSLLDLKDEDWMPHCNATYKNSIRFTNFRVGNGEVFEYPFGIDWDFTDKHAGIDSWSHVKLIDDSYTEETFAEFYNSNTFLAKYNKQTRNKDRAIRGFNFKYDTAYHMDAELFGEYLKENIALPNGVKHFIGNITGHRKKGVNDHTIDYLIMNDDTAIFADLFIDCTGFKSLLLEEYMGVPFVSFDRKLANDKALACRIPYVDRENEMVNVTDCHALNNGWVWTIPLWNRIGTGYVYSSRFCTDAEAEAEFRAHLAKTDPERAENAEMMKINIRHGKRKVAWYKNVVAIGLSYGFLEPLESTGLLTTHENVIKLVSMLNHRGGYVTRSEIEGYNHAVDYEIESMRDFVSMHYAFSMREDTPYWRWCTQLNEYSPLALNDFVQKHVTYEAFTKDTIVNNSWNTNMNGILYIAAGLGMTSVPYRKALDLFLEENHISIDVVYDTKRKYEQYRDHIVEYIKKLPSHYEFLRDEIYGSV